MSNMYPDLNDEKADASAPKANYNATAGSQQKKGEKQSKKESCCVTGAKIWISIVGFLGILLGILVFASALYAKFGYSNYAQLSSTLPPAGIWMIVGFGVTLFLCSVVLMLAARFYDNACFKIILFVFGLVLMVLLIMEIVSGAVLAWGLGVITLPKSEVTDGAADRLIQVRDAALNLTYYECCVVNKPPYNLTSIQKIDSVCLWPNTATAVKDACKATNSSASVLECVCGSPQEYGAYVGLFLKSGLMWVAIVTITFAVLLLGGLICTCVLVWASKKDTKKNTYTPEEQ